MQPWSWYSIKPPLEAQDIYFDIYFFSFLFLNDYIKKWDHVPYIFTIQINVKFIAKREFWWLIFYSILQKGSSSILNTYENDSRKLHESLKFVGLQLKLGRQKLPFSSRGYWDPISQDSSCNEGARIVD